MRYFLSCMLVPLALIVQTSAVFGELRIFIEPKPDPNKSWADTQIEGIKRRLESKYFYGIRVLTIGLDDTGQSRVVACSMGSKN